MTNHPARLTSATFLPPCPLDTERQSLLAALSAGCNLVLGASPGAGKSSRVPLWLLDAPWLEGRNIILLEPRRVAARALASYMASLLGEDVGRAVGLRMRDESYISRHTRIEVVTEGVLTRLLQQNPDLPHTACVLFDEFHERSLTADTGLALCLESQAVLRPDLRILVMSATLDMQAVSHIMGHCPVIQCPGRAYPVEMRHMPQPSRLGGMMSTAGSANTSALWQHMAHLILNLLNEEKGSLLAFLPGAGEIRHVTNLLEGRLPSNILLCPLYGNLSSASQDEAIGPAPEGKRKVVLATSIAETSLTIEGVRIVIDAGLARRSRFDPASGLTRLVTERVSLAGANQRAGRAGRTEPGICCRLWPIEEEKGMRPHIRPEILDADLTGLLLQLAAWGTLDPAGMSWLDFPPPPHLSVARQTLELLDALDSAGRLTDTGRHMAHLPLAPRTARMLLWGTLHGHGPLACCLAALLEEKDPLMPATQHGSQGQRPIHQPDCDLGRRIDWLCHESNGKKRNGKAFDMGQRARLRRQCLRLARFMPTNAANSAATAQSDTDSERFFVEALADTQALGMLVAIAWPEQVSMLQPGDSKGGNIGNIPAAVYRMRSGRACLLSQEDPLARQDFLAVAHVDGALPHGRIRLAAPLTEKMLIEVFAQQIIQQDVTRVSESGQLTTRRQKNLGSLLLEDTPLPRPKPEQAIEALCAYVREQGLNCLPWDEQSLQWRARVALLQQLDGDPWPLMDDQALLGELENWLPPALEGCTSLASIHPAAFSGALNSLLPGHLRRQLENFAPTHWQVPSGAQRPILYGEEGGPTLDVKLQEMFGCIDTPTIAQGRVPLLLRLNSPAGRPLQVTRDLAHFWRNGYLSVRSEMRGRYPRHPWPEDPLTALATALTKKKLAATGKK
ncbi:MAG: ATP-dependent helicase HrpB [Desulfovibrio sp.]|uniref:ATP-dependent helicase HrpB n=1 Tax=Desulfovibrio sp. TaxID=885 RepID=UPI0039E37730